MHSEPNKSCQPGFTSIELMITISVAGILLAAALPSFLSTIASNRLSSQINSLVGDISYSRSEAATRGVRTTMCVSSTIGNTNPTCSTVALGWQAGRMIFVDTNGNGQWDPGETLLRVTPALNGGTILTIAGFSGTPTYIQYGPYGGLSQAASGTASGGTSPGGTFTLCVPSSTTGRRVTIAATGRPLASKYSGC